MLAGFFFSFGVIQDIKTHKVGKAHSLGAKSGVSSQGGKFTLGELSSPTEAGKIMGPTLSTIDPFFSAMLDPENSRRQYVQKGKGLLDKLEKLRLDLIMGIISLENLMALKNNIGQLLVPGAGEELTQLILEIETRAAVELAKYGA